MPDLFSQVNFNDFTDKYLNDLNKAEEELANMIQELPTLGDVIAPAKLQNLTDHCRIMRNFIKESLAHADTLNGADIEAFRTSYNRVMDVLRAYTEQTKGLRLPGREDDAQWYLTDAFNTLMESDSSIQSMINGFTICENYRQSLMNHMEEEQEQAQLAEIGPVGHQPTIEECLTMDPEKMDMKQFVDRMLWMANDQTSYTDNNESGPVFVDSIYGFTFRKMYARIASMPLEKQAEYMVYMERQRLALEEAAYKKYQEILSKLPENMIFDDPEYERLAFKEVRKLPEFQEEYQAADAIAQQQIDERCAVACEPYQARMREYDDIIQFCQGSLDSLNRYMAGTPVFRQLMEQLKAQQPPEQNPHLNYEGTVLLQMQDIPEVQGILTAYNSQRETLEAEIRKNQEAKHKIDVEMHTTVMTGIELEVQKERDAKLLESFRNRPIFREIQQRLSREHMAQMNLSATPEYRSLWGFQHLMHVSLSGANRQTGTAMYVFSHTNRQDEVPERPASIISELINGKMNELQESFSNSHSEVRTAIWAEKYRDRIELAGRARSEQKQGLSALQLNMAESYYKLVSDQGRASEAFTDLRTSLKKVFSYPAKGPEDPADMKQYYKDIQDANRKIAAYLERHKHLMLDKRADRVELAKDLQSKMVLLQSGVSKEIRREALLSAVESLKEDLSKLNDPIEKNIVSDQNLKKNYARILFNYVTSKFPVPAGKEGFYFQQFLNSKALQAAFIAQNPTTLRELIDNPTAKRLEGQLKIFNENANLDKVPPELADRIIAFRHNQDGVSDITYFFDHFEQDGKTVTELKNQYGRLGLPTSRLAFQALALGEMLSKGISLDNAVDPFHFDADRKEAGRTVINAFNQNDRTCAEFCADRYYTAMKYSIDYVNRRMQEMGEFSLQKLTAPENKNLLAALTLLQEAGQDLDKPEVLKVMKEMAKTQPDQYGDYDDLFNRQLTLAGVLGNIRTNAANVLENAAKYDAATGLVPSSGAVELALPNLLGLKHNEMLIRNAQKNNTEHKPFDKIITDQMQVKMQDDHATIMDGSIHLVNFTAALKQPGVFSEACSLFVQDQEGKADITIVPAVNPEERDTLKISRGLQQTMETAMKNAHTKARLKQSQGNTQVKENVLRPIQRQSEGLVR